MSLPHMSVHLGEERVWEWETTRWGIYTVALGCWLINVNFI